MILPDTEILREIESKNLLIDPFEREHLEPATYDLSVGKDAATVPSDGHPRIDLEKERVLLVQPYAPAVVWAREHIRLPLNLAGRFGLKSSLSRRGVYASVGPQVDPGFDGKLSVTMFNLSPTPIALNYGERFLSLELHRLVSPASRAYDGDYQGRDSFTANEIEPLLGYKAKGLSNVVNGFAELQQAAKTVASLSDKFDSFLDRYERYNREQSEFTRALMIEMKKLVEHIATERPRTVVLRTIPRSQAKKEIAKLFKESKSSLFYSDVAEQLNLDLELTVELCSELEKEGVIGVLNHHEAKRPQTKGR